MKGRPLPTWARIAIVMLVLSVLFTVALVAWVASFDPVPLHIVIDGAEPWTFDPSTLSAGHWLALVGGLFLGIVLLAVLIPTALLIALGGVMLGLVVGLGVPLLMIGLLTALALSPVLLLIALGAWLWRRPTANIAP
jgi:hypothetical protein